MRFQMLPREGWPDFLDLPWDEPLEEWDSPRLVEVARGISRHVVRFVEYGGALFALKELPARLAEREYELLRDLATASVPVVDVVGVVSERGIPAAGVPSTAHANADELDAILITRHLEFSLPYRTLFTVRGTNDLHDRLLDALVELLVRLHLAGFFWGDCSLSNTLFRRDAGALAAYLVDAETGEMHPSLSDGQRSFDLSIAEENVSGELLDVMAALAEAADANVAQEARIEDPLAMAAQLRSRYEALWGELTRDEVFGPDERYRIDSRLRRLNQLGFDVEEFELLTVEGGYRLRLPTRVVEAGHHRRRLLMLTGLDVGENQARRLLNDLDRFRAEQVSAEGRNLPDAVLGYRWRAEVFEPALAAIPAELHAKREPAELFHELLDHRWYRSEAAGRDVGMADAVASFVEQVLPRVPDERATIGSPGS
jgi:tRNA A-37 threonylcarbamoyl transferase component Bud32